jgi:hypothetical protein
MFTAKSMFTSVWNYRVRDTGIDFTARDIEHTFEKLIQTYQGAALQSK